MRRLLGRSYTCRTLASHLPSTHPNRGVIEVHTRAHRATLPAAAAARQLLPCLANAAGQLPTTAGRQWRRRCRLAASAVGAADDVHARHPAEPCHDAHRASLATPPLADEAAATAPTMPTMPSTSDVVGTSTKSSILCDTHAACARVRTGTWIRHTRARARIGGGLVRQADRTV